MVITVVYLGLISLVCMFVVDRMVWNAKFIRLATNQALNVYGLDSGVEHARWLLNGNPGTLIYTSGLEALQGVDGSLQGQFQYVIADVTPPDSVPIRRITVTAYYPSQANASETGQRVLFTAYDAVSGKWKIQSEFQLAL